MPIDRREKAWGTDLSYGSADAWYSKKSAVKAPYSKDNLNLKKSYSWRTWSTRKRKHVKIEEEMQKISKLDFNNTVRNPEGDEIEINYVSKDDLFEGHLLLINEGENLYLYIKEYAGDYEEDFVGEYVQIPDDIARNMITKIKE